MKTIEINYKLFCKVAEGIDKKGTRYNLSGVAIEEREEDGKFFRYYIGTDSQIMLIAKEGINKITLEEDIIVKPFKNIKVKEYEYAKLEIGENEATLRYGGYNNQVGISGLIDNKYPNWRVVLPKTNRPDEARPFILFKGEYITKLEKFFDGQLFRPSVVNGELDPVMFEKDNLKAVIMPVRQ